MKKLLLEILMLLEEQTSCTFLRHGLLHSRDTLDLAGRKPSPFP